MTFRSRLVGLYPPSWRARYGEEFVALLEDLDPSVGLVLDVAHAAFRARIAKLLVRTPPTRLAHGPVPGGDEVLARSLAILALFAAIGAVVLFVLHSFAYPLVAFFGVLFALAGGMARILAARNAGPRMR